MKIKFYSGLLLLVFVIIFVVQNTEMVNIQFLLWKLTMPRSFMILTVLTIGILVGWLIAGHFCKAHHDARNKD